MKIMTVFHLDKSWVEQDRKKAFSIYDTGITICRHIEANRFIFTILHKTKIQVNQGSQHKSRYSVP